MLGRSTGAVLLGMDARLVEVEVDLGNGLPTISAVGLAGSAVREGLDRIRAANRTRTQFASHRFTERDTHLESKLISSNIEEMLARCSSILRNSITLASK